MIEVVISLFSGLFVPDNINGFITCYTIYPGSCVFGDLSVSSGANNPDKCFLDDILCQGNVGRSKNSYQNGDHLSLSVPEMVVHQFTGITFSGIVIHYQRS